MICKICNNSRNNKTFHVKEMMFGLRDEFKYFECSNCECLQIEEIPQNIAKYYPGNYYSFHSPVILKDNFIKRYLKMKRDLYAICQAGLVGRLISLIKPPAQTLMALKKWVLKEYSYPIYIMLINFIMVLLILRPKFKVKL